MTTLMNSKYETLNPKQYQMNKIQDPKQYDLEDRTLFFAKRVMGSISVLPKTLTNIEKTNTKSEALNSKKL